MTLPSVGDLEPISFDLFHDERGTLVPIELTVAVPFPVARLFWICDVPPGTSRGGHAHRNCHQFMVCTLGMVRIEAFDGMEERNIALAAGQGLHVPPAIFTTEWYDAADAVLLVLCDRAYDREDYVADRDALAAHRQQAAAGAWES